MFVHNIRGTSDRQPKDGSGTWINFWKRKQGRSPIYCCCESCMETENLVGAHVQETGEDTRDYWYILPLCRKHNNPNFTDSFEVYSEDDLVRITEKN